MKRIVLIILLLLTCVYIGYAQAYKFDLQKKDNGDYYCTTEQIKISNQYCWIHMSASEGYQPVLYLYMSDCADKLLEYDQKEIKVTILLDGHDEIECSAKCHIGSIMINETENIISLLRQHDIEEIKFSYRTYRIYNFRSADTIDAMCEKLALYVTDEGQFGKSKDEMPSANIENVWINYNVSNYGQIGMAINSTWSVDNLEGQYCTYGAAFLYPNNVPLRDCNNRYVDRFGNVNVYEKTFIRYKSTRGNTTLFIPYLELHLQRFYPPVRSNLKVCFYIEDNQGNVLRTYELPFIMTH